MRSTKIVSISLEQIERRIIELFIRPLPNWSNVYVWRLRITIIYFGMYTRTYRYRTVRVRITSTYYYLCTKSERRTLFNFLRHIGVWKRKKRTEYAAQLDNNKYYNILTSTYAYIRSVGTTARTTTKTKPP